MVEADNNSKMLLLGKEQWADLYDEVDVVWRQQGGGFLTTFGKHPDHGNILCFDTPCDEVVVMTHAPEVDPARRKVMHN